MTTPSGPGDAAEGAARSPDAAGAALPTPENVLADPAVSGRHRVLSTIAPGPEDSLYLARRLDTGALVELRVLSGSLGGDRVLGAAFAQHATLVARLSGQCPGILAVHECERTGAGVVLTMERREGPTLREVIKREGTLSLGRALRLGQKLARTLECAHNIGLVHGGLRPENVILVGPEEEVALKYFGFDWVLVSRSPDDGERRASPPEDSSYRAPEQSWDQATPRSDIYALGAILYEMLAGTPPPAGGASRPRINVEPLKNCRADVTPGLERLVTQALQVASERRPADMSVVLHALSAEMTSDGEPRSPEGSVAGPTAAVRMKKLFGWSAAATAGVLAVWFAHARLTHDASSPGPAGRSTPPVSAVLGPAANQGVTQPEPGGAARTQSAESRPDGSESDALAPGAGAPAPSPRERKALAVERSTDAPDITTPAPGLSAVPEAVAPVRPTESPTPAVAPAARAEGVMTAPAGAPPLSSVPPAAGSPSSAERATPAERGTSTARASAKRSADARDAGTPRPGAEPARPTESPTPAAAPAARAEGVMTAPAAAPPRSPVPPAAGSPSSAERATDARDARTPRPGGAPAPAAVAPPRPAETPRLTAAPGARAQGVTATGRRPQPSHEAAEVGDDPGAIIDWLLNEASGKEH
jgi:serine/threonine protein kinase